MRCPTRLTALVASLVVSVALGGCSGGDPEPEAQAAQAGPPKIKVAWEADPVDTIGLLGSGPIVPELTTPDVVALTDGTADLVGLDPSTGENLWTAPVGRPCASSTVTASGRAAVATKNGSGYCRRLFSLDVVTGATKKLDTFSDAGTYGQVAATDRSVIFQNRCTGLRRYDLDTGRRLAELPLDGPCDGMGVASDVIAATTNDDQGDDDSLALYDPDTGRRTARVRGYDDPGLEINAVLSTDPLILDVNERGHRLLRLVSDDGRAGRYLGYQMDKNPVGRWKLIGIEDDVLVASFTSGLFAAGTYGIDLRTGEVLWSTPSTLEEQVLGLQGGGVLSSWQAPGGAWLVRSDLRDLDETEVLGRIESGAGKLRVGLAGDRVLSFSDDAVRGYDVPESGDGEDYSRPLTQVEKQFDVSDLWEEGDVRPEDVDAGCRAVTARGFRTLGWGPDAGLPPAAGCRWIHYPRDRAFTYSTVDTSVITVAPVPEVGAQVQMSAHQAAVAQFEEARPRDAVSIPGLGDEAWIFRQARTRADSDSTTKLSVRRGNLVVVVDVVGRHGSLPGGLSSRTVERAALQVFDDLLQPLDMHAPKRLPPTQR